jgi:hypothetical protein
MFGQSGYQDGLDYMFYGPIVAIIGSIFLIIGGLAAILGVIISLAGWGIFVVGVNQFRIHYRQRFGYAQQPPAQPITGPAPPYYGAPAPPPP